MGPRSPLRIALLIAALVAVVVGGSVFGLAAWLYGGMPARVAAFSMLVAFAASFIIAYFVVKRFIQDRVELIHRTVHETRTARDPGLARSGDVLSTVDAEVAAWAGEKRSEIRELREREQFRREFIGNLAHELRTPIFSIQGYILTLLEGGLEDPKVNRDFLERASSGVDRMIRMVEDLDLITQLESGVITLVLKRMDLNAPVNEVIEALEMKAAERRITLRNELKDEVWVRADHSRLVQVFSNLFANAINYGTEGGWCSVRSFDLGDQVLVEVADNGMGIAPEHLPRLFERFYRVRKSRARNEGGSGLGLAIVKHIVETHGGTIVVKSTEGEGTVFGFTLPKAR